jgi:hypothetical protein
MERFALVPDNVYFRTTIGNARHAGAKRGQAIEATHAGHRDVEPQEFEIASGFREAERVVAAACLQHFEIGIERRQHHRLTHEGLVVDEYDLQASCLSLGAPPKARVHGRQARPVRQQRTIELRRPDYNNRGHRRPSRPARWVIGRTA